MILSLAGLRSGGLCGRPGASRTAHRRVVPLLLAAVLLSPAALAGGGFVVNEHGFYILDFVVFMGALWWFAKGPAAAFLEQRRKDVVEEMERATALRVEAEARLARYEGLLADLEGEVSRLRGEFKADGERERAAIITAGEAQADRIRRETAATIARESAKLSSDLEREVAGRALELAEQLVRERMNADTQRLLVRGFIAELEGRTDISALGA